MEKEYLELLQSPDIETKYLGYSMFMVDMGETPDALQDNETIICTQATINALASAPRTLKKVSDYLFYRIQPNTEEYNKVILTLWL